jgi:hypothetical protein
LLGDHGAAGRPAARGRAWEERIRVCSTMFVGYGLVCFSVSGAARIGVVGEDGQSGQPLPHLHP